MNKQSLPIAFVAIVGIAVALAFYVMGLKEKMAFSSAPSGIPATVTAMNSYTVTTSALQIAATSTCSARIVSTTASPIMLGFTAKAGTTTTATVGLLQAASTTVAYDSGIYGCNQLSAYSFASGLVTVVESN